MQTRNRRVKKFHKFLKISDVRRICLAAVFAYAL